MAIKDIIIAASLTAFCSAATIAAEPARTSGSGPVPGTAFIWNLQSPVAMARSADGSEPAVGNWGDGSVRRHRYGAAR